MNIVIEFNLEIKCRRDGKEYHAYCPALKGLHASGNTKEEAIQNAVELAKLYLTSLVKHNDRIPAGVKIKRTKVKYSETSPKHVSTCAMKNLVLNYA